MYIGTNSLEMRLLMMFMLLAIGSNLFSQNKHIILQVDQTGINDCITNIDQTFDHNQIKVYPNPTNGHFIVEISDGIDKLYVKAIDVAGSTVLDRKLYFSHGNNIQQIDMSNYKGIFLLIIYNENAHYVSKIVIKE